MRQLIKNIAVFILCIIVLCSCGRKEEVLENTTQKPVDWKNSGFNVSGEVVEKQELYVQEYIRWQHEEIKYDAETELLMNEALNMSGTEVGAYGGKIYRLNCISEAKYIQEKRWILEIYDTMTMKNEVKNISFETLGIGPDAENNRFLVDMDVISEGNYVFQWKELIKENEKYREKVNRIIYSDLANTVTNVDLLKIYGELGIESDGPSDYLVLPTGYCVCDNQGNTCILNEDYNRLYILDKQGDILLQYTAPENCRLVSSMRAPSGEVIYSLYNEEMGAYSFIYPNIKSGETKILAYLKDSYYIKQLFGMQGNDIYYEIQEGIVRWNIEDGSRTLVFSYKENGISSYYSTMLVLRDGDSPLLRLYRWTEDGIEDWLVPLSVTQTFEEKYVEIVDLVQGYASGEVLAEVAFNVSKENLGEQYSYETAEADMEDYRTQIFAQLADGAGPDILYVSYADMEILLKKGLLTDYEELLGEEIQETILPGAIDLGTLMGEWIGLPLGVYAESVAITKSVYEEESWSMETMLNMIESGKLKGGLYYPALQEYYSPLGSVRIILHRSMENSFLIDWENGVSHFEDERFLRLLRCMQKELQVSGDEESWFADGKNMVEISLSSINGIYDFGTVVEAENAYYIGYPTDGNCGNYLDTEGFLVVNAKTKNREMVIKYLEEVLGEKTQELLVTKNVGMLSVHKLSVEEIVYDEDGRALWRGQELAVFEDGSTSLHKAKEFLESCIGAPRSLAELEVIIFEELSAGFAEQKTPETIAGIIDSRVQIYLDERQ